MKYILNYFISFACVLGTIAIINWFVDPFGMHWSPTISNVNALKPGSGTRTRITKAYQANTISPDVLIVGNSRVEMGLSPKSTQFKNKKVYNQGMPGAHLVMQMDYAINTIKTTPNIESILVGVDFVDFLLSEKQINLQHKILDQSIKASYSFRLKSQDIKHSYSAAILRLKEIMALIFSLDAFNASLSTIMLQKSLSSSIDKLGFNSALSYLSIMKTEGIKPLFTQKLQEVTSRLKTPLYIASPENPSYSPRFIHLKNLINEATKNKIKVTIFINPYHYSYLHVLSDQGQWQNFLTWKEGLTSFVHEVNSTYDDFEVNLWDFSGFNSIINEAVPLDMPKNNMLWFWEPAHYRKELGEKILARMLAKDKSMNIDFGRRLLQENIQAYISEDIIGIQKSLKKWQELKEGLALYN